MRELSFRKELAPDAGCLAKGQFSSLGELLAILI